MASQYCHRRVVGWVYFVLSETDSNEESNVLGKVFGGKYDQCLSNGRHRTDRYGMVDLSE